MSDGATERINPAEVHVRANGIYVPLKSTRVFFSDEEQVELDLPSFIDMVEGKIPAEALAQLLVDALGEPYKRMDASEVAYWFTVFEFLGSDFVDMLAFRIKKLKWASE